MSGICHIAAAVVTGVRPGPGGVFQARAKAKARGGTDDPRQKGQAPERREEIS